MSDSVTAVVIMAGWLIAAALCALRWERHWFYRFLPITYGFVVGGLVAIRFNHAIAQTPVDLLVGGSLGLLLWFAVWVDAIRGSGKAGPSKWVGNIRPKQEE